MRTELTRAARRIVVKVGTSLISGGAPGLDTGYVVRLAEAIGRERARGRGIALVSSGAIGAGLAALGPVEATRGASASEELTLIAVDT